MATPSQKLATSLEKHKNLQDKGIISIKANDLTRVHRERLMKSGFLREVLKGWYITVPQGERPGDSTSWYISFWSFCARYLKDRFGEDYCLSAEQSLLLHAGNTSVPRQLIIRSTSGNNLLTDLIFGTSIYAMKSSFLDKIEVEEWNGLRIASLTSSIIHCTPSIFSK